MGKTASVQLLSSIAKGSASEAYPLACPQHSAPLWEYVAAGSMVELSGTAPGKLSTVARLVARAQALGEPAAWVSLRDSASFYPPDFVRAGIDLASLVVVRVPGSVGPHGVVRATELLLRSGAFGLVVVDLSHELPRGELTWQSRLSALVRMHDARLVLLTAARASAPSLGPLVALRIAPELTVPASAEGSSLPATQPGRAMLSQRVLKAKLGKAAEPSPDVRSLPDGL